LATKHFHVGGGGGDVDGLPCPLQRPTACNHQTRGQSFLPSATLSHSAAVGGGAFLGVVKPWVLDSRWSVDHLGICVTEFYME
jgi:hypothetical protein